MADHVVLSVYPRLVEEWVADTVVVRIKVAYKHAEHYRVNRVAVITMVHCFPRQADLRQLVLL
jgi:hypothetical protein